jgi:hypothetical protein
MLPLSSIHKVNKYNQKNIINMRLSPEIIRFSKKLISWHGGEAFDVADVQNTCLLRNGS